MPSSRLIVRKIAAAAVAAFLAGAAAGDVELYLLVGQSNMAGRGVLTDGNRVSADGIFKLDADGKWQMAEEPIHFDKPSIAGAGLAASFARFMADRRPGVTVGLIPCAVGGTAIDRWVESGDLWSNAVKRTRIALKSGTLKGILWHQGEADSTAALAPSWGAKLESIIASFRREFGQVPFVAGELGRYLDESGRWQDINAHLHALEGRVPAYRVVSSEGLAPKSDNVHFDTESLREFGLRYAAAMVSCMEDGSDPARPDQELGWVCESAAMAGRTGAWLGDVVYGTGGKAWLSGENTYIPETPSGGRNVELTMTIEMSECATNSPDPDVTAQCAIRLGTNGCFQAWVGGGSAHWIDLAALGVTPQSGMECTFRITLDYQAQTYSVDVLYGGGWIRLVADVGVSSFPIAAQAKRVSGVGFSGDAFFESLHGEQIDKLCEGLSVEIR